MIITIVIDQYGKENNGTTISTRRFAEKLAEKGHEVRVVGVTNDNHKGGEILYDVPERRVPLVTYFSHKQGLLMAKADKKVLKKAINGADVVHLIMPFKIEKQAYKIAKQLNVPVTTAFHVQAENVTSQLGLAKFDCANKFVYRIFRDTFYKNFDYVHCPSHMIANELKANKYKCNTCVISNGCEDRFMLDRTAKPLEFEGKFVILTIGRLSHEKRHDVLIDAIAKSKYKDKIQLVIAGRGPLESTTKAQASKLPVKPLISFFTQEDLHKIINFSDLYVHPADIEIEAIACVEAFKCGVVPIISNNPKCATQQFAITDKCIFEHGNSDDLASKIDYWIEHPEEKDEYSIKYIEESDKYTLDKSIELLEEMFLEAIRNNNDK